MPNYEYTTEVITHGLLGRKDEEFDRRLQQVKDARLSKETRHASALIQLLDKRPELREVIPLAELARERALWCA